MIRNWLPGDHCGVIWRGGIKTRGMIVAVHEKDSSHPWRCASVSNGDRSYLYPLNCLVPVGRTFWTFRHLVATFFEFFHGAPPASRFTEKK